MKEIANEFMNSLYKYKSLRLPTLRSKHGIETNQLVELVLSEVEKNEKL